MLATSLLLGAVYAVVTPAPGGPDEAGHFDYVQFLADGLVDPAVWTARPMLNDSERHQPSTYYWLISPGYVLTRDQSTAVQVVATRSVSLLLLIAEVVFAYHTARLLAPSNRFVYLATPAVVALLPGRLWIASLVNNDNLAAVTSAAAFYLFTRRIIRGDSLNTRLGLGAAMLLVLLSKRSAIPIPVVLGFALLVPLAREFLRSWGSKPGTIKTGNILIGLALLTSLAFALRSFGGAILLSVDSLLVSGLTFFGNRLSSLGEVPPPRPEPFVFQLKSFWFPVLRDDYGLPDFWYEVVCALGILVLLGLLLLLIKAAIHARHERPDGGRALCAVTFLVAIVSVWSLIMLQYVLVVAGTGSFLIARVSDTATHARYLFPALVPIAYFMAVGLGQFVPRNLQTHALSLLLVLLLLLNGVGVYSLLLTVYLWGT